MQEIIKKIIGIVVGNALLALGYALFAVPANLIVGGATGIGLIVERLSGIDYALVVFILNMAMLILGYVYLGRSFALGTVGSSVLFPAFLGLFEKIAMFDHLVSDTMLASVYAGVFIGAGLGIVFRLGYSTGGMDVPPLILNKQFGISLSGAINTEDTLILLGQVFFSNFQGILYGLLTVFITTAVMDRIIVLGEKNVQVLIISQKHEEIAQAIFDEIERGCTFINVTTGYFQTEQKAVLCVANTRQNAKIHQIVQAIDPTAFIINSDVHSVRGRGFTLPNVDLEK